jgi:hypothetical protein
MRAVIHGGEVDRVPFVQYENMVAPDDEVRAVIGRENLGILRWVQAYRIEHPGCRSHTERFERQGLPGERTILETPWGILAQESLIEPTYGTGSRKKHFVKEPEDYDVLHAYLDNSVVVEDLSEVQAAYRDLGEDGLPLVRMERTPFQQLWIQWVNIEDLSYHLVDCPDRVHRCTDAMVRQARKTFEVAARASLDFVDFPDNLTAPIIGEANFRQYCVPLYDELAQMLDERDVPVFVHMDGDLKPLWDAIGESRVRGLDSLSPPPDNDTSAGDAVSLWPGKRVFLNYPSSVHLRSPEEVYDKTGEILEEAGHTGRLQIQISENVPPGVWRKSFPEIVRAIRDFGRP